MLDNLLKSQNHNHNLFQVANLLSNCNQSSNKPPERLKPFEFVTPFCVDKTAPLNDSRSTIKELSPTFYNLSSNSKSLTRSPWSVDEQILFVALYLLKYLFPKVNTMKQYSYLIPTRSFAQIIQHYYRHKTMLTHFAKVFFQYFDFKKNLEKEKAKFIIHSKKSNKKTKGLSHKSFDEKMFFIIKNSLVDKGFVNYFNSRMSNSECIDFFSKIFSFLIFEPKFLIAEGNSNESKAQTNRTKTKENYKSCLKSTKDRNISEISFIEDLRKTNSHKGNKTAKTVKILSERKEESPQERDKSLFIADLQNYKIQIEGELFSKISAFQNSRDNIVIDEEFLNNFIMAGFKLGMEEELQDNKNNMINLS